MQELDDIRSRIKAIAKDLKTVSSKHEGLFDNAITELHAAFREIVSREKEITPEEPEKQWFE